MPRPIKLELAHGRFAVLVEGNYVATDYRDAVAGNTSRSSICSREALEAFARQILQQTKEPNHA